MLSHTLLILTLLLQPLSLAFVGATPGAVDQQGMALRMTMACCEPVVIAPTCCGEPTIAEIVCPMTDGPCQCNMQRNEAPADLPAPMLRISEQTVPAFLLVPLGAVADLPLRPFTPVIWASQGITTNHNRTQAFLGIWRT